MSRRKNRDGDFWDSALMNTRTYEQYLNRLTELATCMFEWNGLPPSVDERFIEMSLFERGVAVYFNDEVMGNLALNVATGGKMDVYNYPKKRRAYASNGYNRNLTNKNSVLIYNNFIRTNSMLDVCMFARRLAQLDRIIDVNCNAQRTPVLIQCTEQERLSMENLLKQYEGGVPCVMATKDLNPNGFKVLKTDAPFNADKLYALKTQYWNEALTYLGISNINVQKKERLISDEVTRNQGGTIASRYSRLQSRRDAVKKINAMFGTQIEVNYREDFQYLDTDIISNTIEQSGGVDDE